MSYSSSRPGQPYRPNNANTGNTQPGFRNRPNNNRPEPGNSRNTGNDNYGGNYNNDRSESLSKPASSATGLLTDEIRELIKLVQASDITELAIENGSQKITLKREKLVVQAVEAAPRAANASRSANLVDVPDQLPVPDPGSPPDDSFHKIVAPMVGTFYRAADPKGKPFVSEGEMVEKGQVIGIIEAMKIMNEIVAEHGGRAVKVNVENGQPVEYGQTLMLLEPA